MKSSSKRVVMSPVKTQQKVPVEPARLPTKSCAPSVTLGQVYCELLEPLFHHALRLRNVYDALYVETATAKMCPCGVAVTLLCHTI